MGVNLKIDRKIIIKWLICFIFLAICMIIPVNEVFTPLCRKFVAVTVFCIILLAFDLLPAVLIGFLLPSLWVLTGCATLAQAMSGWASVYPIMLISAFIFASLLERIGLLQRIGYKTIVLCGGSFVKTVFGLFIACNLIALLTFGIGQPLGIVLGFALAKSLNLKPEDPECMPITLAVLLGVIQSGAYIYSPVSVTMILGAAQAVNPDFQLTWLQLAGHNMPVLLFGIVFLWSYLKWFTKKYADSKVIVLSESDYFRNELNKMGKISSDEQKSLVVLLLMLLYMLIAPQFNLELSYGFLMALIILYLPFINVGATEDISNGLKMSSILVLVLAFVSIGSVGMVCGFSNVIVTYILPIMEGLGPIKSIYATLLIGSLANFILTPGAMIMLLTGPVVQLCTALGYNALPHIYSIYLTEHVIFHPYEWPSYLLILAFGLIHINNYVKLCCIKTVFFLLFLGIFMVPWWLFVTG